MLIKINCVCHNDNLAWKSIQSSIIERGNADYCNIITSSHMNILSHNTKNQPFNLQPLFSNLKKGWFIQYRYHTLEQSIYANWNK